MKTPRGIRNNNPGNIRNSLEKWQGEIQPSQDPEFKQFEIIEYGYRAMFKLLNNYQKIYKLNTLSQIINKYAPSNENHTDRYIDFICRKTSIGSNEYIDTMDEKFMIPIVSAMSEMENGIKAEYPAVRGGWNLFYGK